MNADKNLVYLVVRHCEERSNLMLTAQALREIINHFHVIYPSGRTKHVQFISRKN